MLKKTFMIILISLILIEIVIDVHNDTMQMNTSALLVLDVYCNHTVKYTNISFIWNMHGGYDNFVWLCKQIH